MKTFSEEMLLSVSKPGRYLGNEWNAVKKTGEVKLRVLLAFPDVYDIGMSHLGLKVLYSVLNAQPEIYCERCFAPWEDMEKLMRTQGIPLVSLETRTPAREFDIIGFSLNSELNYTNVLNMLDLAGIEKDSRRRGVPPLIIGGGPCCFNPEPMADFFDVFCLGDGEEAILEIAGVYQRLKPGKQRLADQAFKTELLLELSRREGIYVPGFYRTAQDDDGIIRSINPIRGEVPAKVRKRIVTELSRARIPTEPPVPFIEVVHDRIVIEIMRGCLNGCRFCQAGMIYRPQRERKIGDIVQAAGELYRRTGYEELSLLALSCGDYPDLIALIGELQREFQGKGVNISLPSLRIRSGLESLPPLLRKVRKSGLTMAPEAGSERLRRVINKDIDADELRKTAICAWREGWRRLKLYFMIGLPTEEDADLDGVIELTEMIADSRRSVAGGTGSVAVTIASFVPKPFTPFQWEAMDERNVLLRKQTYLRRKGRRKNVELKFTDVRSSFLEATLSRGDRRLGMVIRRAWENGAVFDSWSSHFVFERWQEAFRNCGLEPEYFVSRPRPEQEIFPWEHLDAGVSRRYLWEEREKSERGEMTPSCRCEDCRHCGVCHSG